jgi:hypothetical protein
MRFNLLTEQTVGKTLILTFSPGEKEQFRGGYGEKRMQTSCLLSPAGRDARASGSEGSFSTACQAWRN